MINPSNGTLSDLGLTQTKMDPNNLNLTDCRGDDFNRSIFAESVLSMNDVQPRYPLCESLLSSTASKETRRGRGGFCLAPDCW